ncbi:MAG: sialidase family protein, partial [Cyanobacteria bacterium P01_G01_bin.38]
TFEIIGDQSLAYARMFNVPSAGRPIQFSPNYAEDNTVFAFGSATTEVFRSTDGGSTWQVLTTPEVEAPTQLSSIKRVLITAELSRGKLTKIGLAAGLALIGYLMVGFLHLEKMLKIKRRLLQFGTAMGTFAISLVTLFKVL